MRTKILLLSVICFLLVLHLNAQINKGRYLIGGSLGLYDAKASGPSLSKQAMVNTNIQLGKIVNDNTVVGITFSYNNSNYTYPGGSMDTLKNNNYGAGVFYRKYQELLKNLTFFGEVDLEYGYSKNYDRNSGQSLKTITNGGSVFFVPGISYAISKKFQVELVMPNIISVGYSHNKTETSSTQYPVPASQKVNTFFFNTNLNENLLSSFGIGFKILL